ncbi:glycosyltransferase [Acinetobacter thermotolerans]|uniref:glycosyltransferase n=1 Tax=Acinetobacter thermotolerans TaxID=3151487 RepID=UPI00325A4B5B
MYIEPQSDRLNLVFASDDKYLPYTAVTLASVLKNYKGVQPITVYLLLDRKMSNQHYNSFIKLMGLKSFDLNQIVVDASKFEGIKTSAGISIATYYRLLMHKLLPSSVEKVLYLDSDLIIRKSIDLLYNEKFDGCYFAGVEDSISLDYNKKFGVPEDGAHINAGVLMVNLLAIRSIDFSGIIDNYIKKNKYRISLGDQQIICELFFDKIKYLPVKWNVHGSMFVSNWADKVVGVKNNMNIEEAKEAIKDPGIVHYTLKRKPWISLEHPKSELWFEYLSLTPYISKIKKPNKANTIKSNSSINKKNYFGKEWQNIISFNSKNKKDINTIVKKVIPGYLLSIKKLRETRLKVDRIIEELNKIQGLEIHLPIIESSNRSFLERMKIVPTGPTKKEQALKDDLDVRFKSIVKGLSTNRDTNFDPHTFIKSIPENCAIQSNFIVSDVDGGQHENLKNMFRTNNICYDKNKWADFVVIHSLRLKQGMMWDCLEHAYLYDKLCLFVEVSLFSGFASYFDKEAKLIEKKAVGFIVDDLGYYYDARQPSRIEKTLNDPNFKLTSSQQELSKKLIKKIVDNNLTKYNKYTKNNTDNNLELLEDSVLVVEQKNGDASLRFAGVEEGDFGAMLQQACLENPNSTVYLKRHPDNILGHKDYEIKIEDYSNLVILPDHVSVISVLDKCHTVYTLTSQVGFEALLRGKKVKTFGLPFYAGWGLTDDAKNISRRSHNRTIEEIFYVICIMYSVYIDSKDGSIIDMEKSLDLILSLRDL